MKVYKVCPECGSNTITRTSYNVIVDEYLYQPFLETIEERPLPEQEDYESLEDSEEHFDQATTEFICSECGHPYDGDNLYDVLKLEMITPKEWEEKQDEV